MIYRLVSQSNETLNAHNSFQTLLQWCKRNIYWMKYTLIHAKMCIFYSQNLILNICCPAAPCSSSGPRVPVRGHVMRCDLSEQIPAEQ